MAIAFQRMLVQLTWVCVILSATMAAAATPFPIALPGCPDRCGDVEIPYPFGMKEGCYLNQSKGFLIKCTMNSSGKLQPLSENVTVTKISIEGQIDGLMPSAIDCYDKSGQPANKLGQRDVQTLNNPIFTFSGNKNKLVAVGCDTYAYLRGSFMNEKRFSSGCWPRCENITTKANGTCDLLIPCGLKNISWTASSGFYNHTNVSAFNPCSYAFIIRQNEFSFSENYLTSLPNNGSLPIVLDWAIGSETCEVARNNKANYLCGENSTCIDLESGSGYRCKCNEGYRGNPYHKDGCQDIDECKQNKHSCNDKKICVNQPGTYACSCINEYKWDDLKRACVRVFDRPDKSELIIGLAVGTCVISLLALGCSWIYWGLKRRKLIKLKEKFFQQNGGLLLKQQLSNCQNSVDSTKIFTTEELKKATNNYDESRILGQGGYGTVYRGVLSDNTVVAIKKSKIGDQSQIEQFINEMIVLTQINHRNVVKLFGCCLETKVPLVVYEFITNGTLSNHIHDKGLSCLLTWEKRLKIATETAGALAYLHSATSMPIIHRDVKTANILLDDNYTAKVSDFGASRLIPLDQTQLTTLVQGTLGYLDPEYLQTSQLTEKSDVYSFGVVMAELLTGKKALSFDRPEIDRNLAISFVSAIKKDRLFQIIEDHIINEGNIDQLKEVANLAQRCLKLRGEDRPSMKELTMELERLRRMEKHPLGNIDAYAEKTEYFLGTTSHSFNIDAGCSTTTTAEYDSIKDQELNPTEDGR